MKRSLLLLVLVATSLAMNAQMLLVDAGPGDPTTLHFNTEFIRRNSVKSVKGQDWTKKDGRPMVARNRFYLYRFGETGRLGFSNTSFGKPGSGVDTASVIYTTGTDGRLLEELHNDPNGWYALRSEFDAGGRPVRTTHVRIENLSTDRYRLQPGANTVISDETFSYADINDTTVRKTCMNDRGRPYREEVSTRNALGYLLRIDDRNLITQRMGRTTFTYDAKGRLKERTTVSDLGRPFEETWRWTYDAAGNPITRDLLRNGVLTRHSEYVYAEGTLFLKAVVTRDKETGLIELVRYDIER